MKQIWELLSSRRVALYLFFIILAASMLGAFLPQGQPFGFYEATYVSPVAKAIIALKLYDIYHTWYFTLLLVLLTASIATCSIRRAGRIWALVLRSEPDAVGDWPVSSDVGAARPEDDLGTVVNVVPAVRWRRTGGGWYGRKHRFAPLGEFLTHAGLVVILVAAALRTFGHRETVYVFEDNAVMLPAFVGDGYELFAEKVEEVADANTGDVLEFRTRARLSRYGQPIVTKDVEVNEPLSFGGFGVYQSEMDVFSARGLTVSATKLRPGVKPEDFGRADFTWVIGAKTGRVEMVPGEQEPLGDSGYVLAYADYYERFLSGEEGVSDRNPKYNPAALIIVRNPRGDVGTGIVFKLYPEYSMLRQSDPTFGGDALNMRFTSDAADPFAASQREYVFASGSTLPLAGGETLTLVIGPGEGTELRQRELAGMLTRRDGKREGITLPFGARVKLALADGEYLFRFTGARRAPVSGMVVSKDPGLLLFYIGCALLSLGICAATLLRRDELFVIVRDGRTVLAGRSNKGSRVFREDFERWAGALRRRLEP